MMNFKTELELATVIISIFALGAFCYFLIKTVVDTCLCISEKVQERKLRKWIDENYDKRSFECGEIVWYGGTKYRVDSYKWHDYDLRIILELSYLDSNHLFNFTGVDSVYVKKVESVYARFGDKL